jgi:hypothetical protein
VTLHIKKPRPQQKRLKWIAQIAANRTSGSNSGPHVVCQLAVGYPFLEPVRIGADGREHRERIRTAFNTKVAAFIAL